MARTCSTQAKTIQVYNTSSFSEPEATIELEKVSYFDFVPRTGENVSKPLYFIVCSCGPKETVTRVYQFPKLQKEKFVIKTQGSQEANLIISPDGHAVIIWQQTHTDKTGKNYYGGHFLMYNHIYGKN
jgi:translation initiation factor 2A